MKKVRKTFPEQQATYFFFFILKRQTRVFKTSFNESTYEVLNKINKEKKINDPETFLIKYSVVNIS